MEKIDNFNRNSYPLGSPEDKIRKPFCEDGNCEIKVYKDRKYMIRKRKKVS